jgi:hypothetical protein
LHLKASYQALKLNIPASMTFGRDTFFVGIYFMPGAADLQPHETPDVPAQQTQEGLLG